MQTVVSLYKPLGMTPLGIIEKWKEKHPEYNGVTLSYAGRLDPMAEGVVLVLVGDENKKRKDYENLPKTYAFSLLIGISTDTYDILGKITAFSPQKEYPTITSSLLNSFTGKQTQMLPPYSSYTINGKPLYYWARRNKLTEITLPINSITIASLKLKAKSEIYGVKLMAYVESSIKKVAGDFRQKEILLRWHKALKNIPDTSFPTYQFEISCSSGTYVRSLVNAIGIKLDIPTLTLHILRTAVAKYSARNALRL